MLRVLGTGATARAFLVQRDGLESVLKVGRSALSEDCLGDEAVVLEGLRNEHSRAAAGLKFSAALPVDLAQATVGERLGDTSGGRTVLGEPRRATADAEWRG
ncbi:MAG: hypothetical protein ABI775_10390 [Pseudonocardiales bacterium]